MPQQNADKKKPAGGDAPTSKTPTAAKEKESPDRKGKKVVVEIIDPPTPEPDPNDPMVKAEMRKKRFRKQWPEVTKVEIKTRPWRPPGPPQKPPPIRIQMPALSTRQWVPPSKRRRKQRPKLQRITPDKVSQPLYECATLKKVWHNFVTVQRNKMMLQGTTGCNSKRYSAAHSDSQTGCIAAVCLALLEEKSEAQLTKRDVDDIIDVGDKFHHQCMLAMKCYKGSQALALDQMLPYFFLHDTKYTYRLLDSEKGVVVKNQDVCHANDADFRTMMEKRAGTKFAMVLTIDDTRHFLVWGHPPDPESGSAAKTICYLFDPHMLNEIGQPQVMFAGCCDYTKSGAAFLRYPGIQSLVLDFLANYADLDCSEGMPKQSITLTNIEIAQKEPLIREALWDLDLKARKIHCYSEWASINMNSLIERKQRGEFPRASLSAVSLATSRAKSKVKLQDYLHKRPPEGPVPPVPPEKGPPVPTLEQVIASRGEDFFLYCTSAEAHLYGRDDYAGLPHPKSETILHSLVDIADRNCNSQYQQMDVGKWLLRATRHMASYRYQTFKVYTAVACCVAALAVQQRLRARSWNEDTLDETLDVGYNLFRESLAMRGGPIRRLVLGELKDSFVMRDKEYKFKERGIAVWGKIVSNDNKVFDLCRGIDHFFKEADSGVLQIPGEIETTIMNEGGKFYIYIPWPSDSYGQKVDIRAGGKACILYFDKTSRLCDYFLENWVFDMRRKPFSISEVDVFERPVLPPPLNNLKAVSPNRWVVRGGFHEGDSRFPEEHRNKQATPMSIAAIAMAHIVDPNDWTPNDVNETLERGDVLYQSTLEHLDRMGIALDTTVKQGNKTDEDEYDEMEDQDLQQQGPTGTLAAIDVLNRFKITDTDCIETEVLDSAYSGKISGNGGILPLRESLKELFKNNQYAVLTARGGSMAVWQRPDEDHKMNYYFFDPHGCDENGYPAPSNPRAAACLVRVVGSPADLADTIESNLAPGADDSFNLSPVSIVATKLNPVQNVPETVLESEMCGEFGGGPIETEPSTTTVETSTIPSTVEIVPTRPQSALCVPDLIESKAFEWFNKESRGTAAIMQGPRGENSALGKAAEKAGIGSDDFAGRQIGLPAAAAFCAAAVSVPPPHMHQDHMFNLLDAGADYYNEHVKKTGRRDITPEDLTQKFEMGANTFSIELEEPVRLPLRFPDEGGGEGEGDEDEEDELGEGEEPGEKPPRQIKEMLQLWWNDTTKPNQIMLLVGDYHQLGVWMQPGGKVVVFDPAPTLMKGFLTKHRIKKGDELRLQRLKDEMTGEGEEDEDDDEEAGGEGEEVEVEPEFVPPESCPVLMVFAGPKEFIDKLASQGPLTPVQTKAPYKLYPVKVTNELTSLLRDRRGAAPAAARGDEAEEEEGQEQDLLVEELPEEALGKYYNRLGRSAASVRGRVSQNEAYFLDHPNRDHQDACNAVMGIVVDSIEPHIYWKPSLIDAILKYGDRLYTFSLPRAKTPPNVRADEIASDFHATNFNIHLEVDPVTEQGDIKAGPTGAILDVQRAITNFFEAGHKYGVICCKNYCASIWRNEEGNAYCYWDSHAVGPRGKPSPGGSASLVLFSNIEEMAETYKANIESLIRPGNNKFTIQAVKVEWEYAKPEGIPCPGGKVPDETYECKVLTAYVEMAKGRTILRASMPDCPAKFARSAVTRSACGAVAAACLARMRRPSLWSARTLDEALRIAGELFTASICSLGYEFRPGEDLLLPLQVMKRFIIGVNYVHFDLQEVYTGRLENPKPHIMSLRCALELFFETSTSCILWSAPYAVAMWKCDSAPNYYMMEPHACGPTGLRCDADEEGTACVMTFTSPKTMAFAYQQNIPAPERRKHEFILYGINISVKPIKPLCVTKSKKSVYSMVADKPGKAVPATSRVDVGGKARRADEDERKHPPGDLTCNDAVKATTKRDEEVEEIKTKLKGHRSANGWLVLCDGTQFLSSTHSMSCRQFSQASRGNQAIPMCVMAVAMSRVEDVCKWCSHTLDQILTSGDQLYQDSYLHYKPQGKILKITQVLRKFYTPGNCVCRVVVYAPRQQGNVSPEMLTQVTNFFREERCGVFVAGDGALAVALFKTNRGYYMFDPADRDRYGRAVPPVCTGKARACLSLYLNVKSLVAKLGANIPPGTHETDVEVTTETVKSKNNEVKVNASEKKNMQFSEPGTQFTIYGMDVTSLRRPKMD